MWYTVVGGLRGGLFTPRLSFEVDMCVVQGPFLREFGPWKGSMSVLSFHVPLLSTPRRPEDQESGPTRVGVSGPYFPPVCEGETGSDVVPQLRTVPPPELVSRGRSRDPEGVPDPMSVHGVEGFR